MMRGISCNQMKQITLAWIRLKSSGIPQVNTASHSGQIKNVKAAGLSAEPSDMNCDIRLLCTQWPLRSLSEQCLMTKPLSSMLLELSKLGILWSAWGLAAGWSLSRIFILIGYSGWTQILLSPLMEKLGEHRKTTKTKQQLQQPKILGGGGGGDTIVRQEKTGEKKIFETEQGLERLCRINKQES